MNLISAKEDLQYRKDETEQLLELVLFFEESFVKPEGATFDLTRVKTSIKANIVLMLYNAVESTVTNALTGIHEHITEDSVNYGHMIPEIKKLLGVYYGYSIEKSKDMQKKIDNILAFLDVFSETNCFSIPYQDFSESYQLYSGNLDTREIIKVLKKYGIRFNEKCSELHTIKTDRNILAHGEASFEEIGRRLTVQQLSVMKTNAFTFLDKMIMAVENYLSNNEYKVQSSEETIVSIEA